MTTWTSGYVADVGYTYGYYSELNPLRARFALLSSGLAAPEMGTACELGFGQGLSINLHAAASPVAWWGTDFNPSQAAFANELAGVSGATCRLFDEAFAAFCARPELPEFDYIGLHGIWSWISEENRAVIVDFLRRKLKVGGVLYISYNTLPGWAQMVPMRHLLTEHAEVMAAPGRGIVSRIDAALEFAEKLLATQPLFGRANPGVGERLARIKEQNRHYLAHEYFNRDWHPMHFADMAHWLEPAKVSYACSAHFLEHVDAINLSAEQQQFLADIPDRPFRESVRDFMVNQQFRRDYWVRGARRLSPLEQAEGLRNVQVILISARDGIKLSAQGALGEATMQPTVYEPLLDSLASHRVQSLREVEAALAGKSISFGQILQAILVLVGKGDVALAQDEGRIKRARPASDAINKWLMHKARGSNDIGYLASPVTGGGVTVGRFPQMFLLAASRGVNDPAQWAREAWTLLAAQGQKIVKEGRTLEAAEDNLAELTAQARAFAEGPYKILKALRVAGG